MSIAIFLAIWLGAPCALGFLIYPRNERKD